MVCNFKVQGPCPKLPWRNLLVQSQDSEANASIERAPKILKVIPRGCQRCAVLEVGEGKLCRQFGSASDVEALASVPRQVVFIFYLFCGLFRDAAAVLDA